MAKKSIDELWIDKLLKEYDGRRTLIMGKKIKSSFRSNLEPLPDRDDIKVWVGEKLWEAQLVQGKFAEGYREAMIQVMRYIDGQEDNTDG